MKIHEYQAKAVLRSFGVPVPRGEAAFSVEEAEKVARELGSDKVVVKAQIHAGGRGKGGGVKLVGLVANGLQSCDEVVRRHPGFGLDAGAPQGEVHPRR